MWVTAENKPLQSGSSSGLSTIPDVSLMHSGPFPSTHTNYLLMTLINANSAGSVLHREVCPSAPGGAPPSPVSRGLLCGGSGDKSRSGADYVAGGSSSSGSLLEGIEEELRAF